MDNNTIAPRPDHYHVRRCARIERRIDLVRRAGEAADVWSRPALRFGLAIYGCVTGPHLVDAAMKLVA